MYGQQNSYGQYQQQGGVFNPNSVAIQPIASLTPFLGGKQWIKARATDKSDVRTWNKPNSSGKLFSCTFMDDTASIRATFFNDAVDAFHAFIRPGVVYYVGGGSIKNANRRFSNVNNEYEMSLDKDAQIHEARDAADNIPTQRYNFVPLVGLDKKEDGSPVDVLAVVTKIGNPTKLVTKDGKELTKRDITASDQNAAVDITLWGDDAINFSASVGNVFAFRNVRVKHFNGVSLSVGSASTLDINPEISDRRVLETWYKTTGGTNTKSLSGIRGEGETGSNLGYRYFRHIESEGLGRGEKADFIIVPCVTTFIKTDAVWYDACPTCNKKVVPLGDSFRCEKCNSAVMPTARYMSTIQCSDGVTAKWLTLFSEAAEVFWGVPAAKLKQDSSVDPQILNRIAQSRLHKPALFTVRVKEERGQTMQDGTALDDRIRLTAVKVVDFIYPPTEADTQAVIRECTRLVDSISVYHR